MAAFDDDAVQVEIAEPGVLRARRMAGGEAGGGARIVAALGLTEQLSRGPASGSASPAVASNSSETRGSASRFCVCWARSDSSSSGAAS